MNRILKAMAAIVLLVVGFSSFTWVDVGNLKEKPTAGTLNGHEWVDLGLPSGLLWATCNIGAVDCHQAGNYFVWGEVETNATVNWGTGWRTPTVADFDELLHVCKWDWREEIIHQPTGLPLIKNGGYQETGPNGNSIFLSPTGFKCPGIHDSHIGNYWAGTLKPNELYCGSLCCGLTFWRGGDPYIYYFYSRMYGLPIRPVCSAKR